jgi:zinc transporter, ZIP family
MTFLTAWFTGQPPVLQALLAGTATWWLTAVGAALVFTPHRPGPRTLDALFGFAAGVMIAASFWSLLAPSIELSGAAGLPSWGPPLAGFLAGGAFLWVMNRLLPHLHPGDPPERAEGPHTAWRRSVLLVLAITLHNIPEGLAVGVAFGAAAAGVDPVLTTGGAVALAVGIGLQNVPEGLAVALPLRATGVSAPRSFFYGQLSALVEPLAAVVGAAAVLWVSPLLPYALAFAAGAMIYVVVEELIPRSRSGAAHGDAATAGAMVGFALMMVLDVALG